MNHTNHQPPTNHSLPYPSIHPSINSPLASHSSSSSSSPQTTRGFGTGPHSLQ
ncbi:hypothetical protein M430DRAFT_154750 [Amorphotheca resinae ATCC 22711]|uniref:Uncharacterized protein n=1 Tax=Amorphotheca resinae ATCC 22711 TaxID=857342 RepID=A0A2T3BDK3_AMORE|nr:hypothetical protein M430DRAFT_154750 [Amorphotheca resinae ATCC 22711]PSS27489.1 hypothetical protein M430DRAFT_154750 [Amorphotheca resinae ATCC 22711]